MKRIIIFISTILLIVSCNSARIYDRETYIVGFNDGTYIECVGYDVSVGYDNEYIIKSLDGHQFFDKSKVKFIYIKNEDENKFERIQK